jgi:hypothetical protein
MTPSILAEIERLRRELRHHQAPPTTVNTEEEIAA